MSDYAKIAEELVASWPALSVEQKAVIGSMIGGAD